MDDYISYNSQKEMEAITSWYSGWKDTEKHLFIQTLQQLVNPSIDDLTGDMVGCKIQRDWSAPNIFTCQMKLLRDWFRLWDLDEKKAFECRLRKLLDPTAIEMLFGS